MDFQYPSGFGLKRRVLDALGPQHPIRALVQACEFDQLSIQNFRTALAHSGALSVGTFLEHQSQYLPLGKAAIAAALIPLENPENLFPVQSSPTWLELMLQRLHGPLQDWNSNQLSIVTFNYDRVIEQFFSQALMSRYGISLQKAAGPATRDHFPSCMCTVSLGALRISIHYCRAHIRRTLVRPSFSKRLLAS